MVVDNGVVSIILGCEGSQVEHHPQKTVLGRPVDKDLSIENSR